MRTSLDFLKSHLNVMKARQVIYKDMNKDQVCVVESVIEKMINQTSCFVVLNTKSY